LKRKLFISVLIASLVTLSAGRASADETSTNGNGDVLLTLPPDVVIVESVDLAGNMQLRRTASNALVLGPVGTDLVVVQGPAGPQLAVAIPDPADSPTPGWTTEKASDVVRRAGNGESFHQLQREFPATMAAAAAPETEGVQNEVCLYGSPAQEKYGFIQSCTTRQNVAQDATYRWTTSSSWTYAQSNQGNLRVAEIVNKDSYTFDEPIQAFTPMDVIKQDNCTNFGLNLTFKGVGVSMSKNVCPDEIVPKRTTGQQNGFQTTWKGREVAAHTEQIEGARGPVNSGNKMVQSGTATLKAKCTLGPLCALPFFYD
jgi:hypothetical protein